MSLPPPLPLPIGPFAQTIYGLIGNDTITGSTLADLIYGGDGNDRLSGGAGNDFLDGGAGNDRLAGQGGNDTLLGGSGNDTLIGGGGSDTMFGGDGNDSITATGGSSLLVGGAGNDTLTADLAGGGYHTLFGGDGTDMFALTSVASAAHSELVFGDFKLGEDHFSIDGLADTAVMNSGVYMVATALGVRLTLASGDIIHFDGFNNFEAIAKTYGLGGDDIVIGSTGKDRIFGGAGNNNLDGADGDDLLVGGEFNDTLYGGNGDDNLNARRGEDWVYGGNGDDMLFGNVGKEHLFGEDGDDYLYTGRDSSFLNGGDGNDRLSAKIDVGGDHTLTGGAGQDTFEFLAPAANRGAHSVITDFSVEEDHVTINGLDLAQFVSNGEMVFSGSESEAVLFFNNGAGSITFEGVSAYQMQDIYGSGDWIIS